MLHDSVAEIMDEVLKLSSTLSANSVLSVMTCFALSPVCNENVNTCFYMSQHESFA